MYNLIYSPESLEDIKFILQYTFETFGEKQMNIYYGKIEKCIDAIKAVPTIGHYRNDKPEDTIAFNLEKNTVIYKVIESKKVVQILRILYSKIYFDIVF
jgi:plasmid stabilization system protein ParE